MSLSEAVAELLSGKAVSDAINDLLDERVVCRYVGPPKRMTRRGRTYYVRSRQCTGTANPTRKQRSISAWRGGGAKQKAKISQKNRWRNFKPTTMRSRQLPGRSRR